MKDRDAQAPAAPAGRRGFLVGLLTGGGAVAALAGVRANATADRGRPGGTPPAVLAGPVLYRRTAEAERYYRTLHS